MIMYILIAIFLIIGNVYAKQPEEELFDKGDTYYEKQMYDEAIIAFTTAIQINLRYTEAYLKRGIVYYEKGDPSQAISDLSKVIELDLNNVEAYFYRGLAYSDRFNFDRAISDYSKAIDIGSSNLADIYRCRAMAYFSKQEYDKSWEDVHRAQALGVEIGPEFLEALKRESGREE